MAVSCKNLPLGKEGVNAGLVPVLLTELIGTFFLVFTVYLTVAQGAFLAPLAIGTSLGVMVYMGGHVSGAHYNPAVTFGLVMSCRDKIGFTWLKLGFYIGAQVVGGILAGLIGYGLTGAAHVWSPAPGARGLGPAFVAEVIFTFALTSVVLNVATSNTSTVEGKPNAFFGFCIGMILFVGAVSIGQLSGCVINPAVGTGIILVHAMFGGGVKALSSLWLYWVAPMAGAALAAAVYFITNPREYSGNKAGDEEAQKK